MKIQIWSGRMGGHVRVAEALAWALRAAQPESQVQIVDVYNRGVVTGAFSTAANSYERLVTRAPRFWGLIFALGQRRPALRAVRWLGRRLTRAEALRQLAVDDAPDVIVGVISDLGQADRLAEAVRPAPPLVTVVSDLVTVPRAWITPRAQLVVAPSEAAYMACRQYGVPQARLRRAGFPIRAHLFCRAGGPNGHRPDGALRVLAMGGSAGAGRLIADVQALLASDLPLALTVVCGHNRRLQQALSALAAGTAGPRRLLVLGYTDEIPELMCAADVLLSKAGPSTVFEAVASRLPVILTGSLPGQEAGNSRFFTGAGVAVEAATPAETVRLARRFVEDPGQLLRLRNPALARETCLGARQIAELILEAAPERRGTAEPGTRRGL
ncbi:MAG: hypothetical protein IT318_12075 [Anaerolineales bacterium]|nr:hypothetical protein [Anaerolineales bacterium]